MYKHKGSLISLCNVLLKYTSDPSNCIYWIRKLESGGSDVNDNRRGAVTKVKCKDGKYCTYAYTCSSCKGLLKKSNIDDEIANASGDFKTVLEEIKKRWLKI